MDAKWNLNKILRNIEQTSLDIKIGFASYYDSKHN